MAVFTFGFADLLHQFDLALALDLDGFVGGFEGAEHLFFGNLFAFAFHHADVLHGGSHHQFEASFLLLFEGGVDDVFVTDEGDANLGDRAVERDVGHADGSRGGQSCKGIGSHVLLCGEQVHLHDGLGMVVIREQGTQGAVDQTGDKHLVVGGLGFTLEETTGELAGGIVFFAVVD